MKFKNYLFVSPKRFLAVALASTLVFGGVSTITSAMQQGPEQEIAQQAAIWDGDFDISWYNNHQGNSYMIKNAKELAGLAFLVNYQGIDFEHKKIKLVANIKCSEHTWQPIGLGVIRDEHQSYVLDETKSKPFKGTFNGMNHSITGIRTDYQKEVSGLFGVNNGIIQNVKLVANNINGKQFVGGVAGYNSGRIEGSCNIQGSVSAENNVEKNYVSAGGVVGMNNGTISRSFNQGSVSSKSFSSSYAGGVVGWNIAGQIENSYNGGLVSSQSNHSVAGGVVGVTASSRYKMENIYNTGSVSSRGNNSAAGGVAGLNISGKMQYAYNIGSVISEGNVSKAGGVVGEIWGGRGMQNIFYNINCEIKGNTRCEEGQKIEPEDMKNENFVTTGLGNAFIKLNEKINDGYPILKSSCKSIFKSMIDSYVKKLKKIQEKFYTNYDIYRRLYPQNLDDPNNNNLEMKNLFTAIINEFNECLNQNKNIDLYLVDPIAEIVPIAQKTQDNLLPDICNLNKEDLNTLINNINMISNEIDTLLNVKNTQFEIQQWLYKDLLSKMNHFRNVVKGLHDEYFSKFEIFKICK